MKSDPKIEALLREIVQKRNPSMSPLLARLGSLEESEIETLRGLVSEEMCETGLDAEGELDERGRMLDELIGWIGMVGSG